jgi:type III restriction enzyme
LQNLVDELKEDFGEEKVLSANDNKDLVSIKLNTLEDKNNLIRAVFAVAKLNEGWDVLNLFDIVRLY